MKSLGARPLFAWNEQKSEGILLPVFRVPAALVGFLGFPVGGELLDRVDGQDLSALSRELAGTAGLSLVRTVRSVGTNMDTPATSFLPEVRIEGLQSWSPVDRKLRKDLSYARKRSMATAAGASSEVAGACFTLYRDTVLRHGGRVRYSRDYFVRLAELSTRTDRARLFVATLASGDFGGFAVVAGNGRTAYYLHGAVSEPGRSAGASDVLLEQVVAHARSLGCESLSLMASPWQQPGLVEFKKKWGNQLGLVATTDYVGGLAGSVLATLARWKSRGDRGAAMRWLAAT